MIQYKATLNWYGELYILYTSALNERKALTNATVQLARKLGKTNYSVRQYFSGEKDRYKVERR